MRDLIFNDKGSLPTASSSLRGQVNAVRGEPATISRHFRRRAQMRRIKKLWLRVQEPRAVSTLYFFAYLAVGFLGLAVAADPPRAIQSTLGLTLIQVWGWLLIFGGGIGALTALPGWWWLERVGVILCVTAIGIYGVAICFLPLTQFSTRIATVCFFVIPCLTFAARLVKIRHFSYDPEK